MELLSPEVRAQLDVAYWQAGQRVGFVPFTCEDCGLALALIADGDCDPCHNDVGYVMPEAGVSVLSHDTVASLAAREHGWQACRAAQGLPDRMG